MRDNLAKRALREGRPVFGIFVRYPDPTLVEVVAYHGLGLRRSSTASTARSSRASARTSCARPSCST